MKAVSKNKSKINVQDLKQILNRFGISQQEIKQILEFGNPEDLLIDIDLFCNLIKNVGRKVKQIEDELDSAEQFDPSMVAQNIIEDI